MTVAALVTNPDAVQVWYWPQPIIPDAKPQRLPVPTIEKTDRTYSDLAL